MAESYRIQLKSLRRGRNQSLVNLANEIRRLFGLAYPNETGILADTLALELFLDALGDVHLANQIRLLDPVDTEHAVRLGARLELLAPAGGAPDVVHHDRNRRDRPVHAVQACVDTPPPL
jgi:hypothetical protein